MADKETNATAGKEKRKERWLFTDEMVEELLELLRDTKSNMAGKGLDFEGDLVKLYADIRTMMAEKFEESDFGPKEIMQPSVEIDEMSRDEYREFKKKVDEQERAIKLGYNRIKAKVKKLRSGFQKMCCRVHKVWEWKNYQGTLGYLGRNLGRNPRCRATRMWNKYHGRDIIRVRKAKWQSEHQGK